MGGSPVPDAPAELSDQLARHESRAVRADQGRQNSVGFDSMDYIEPASYRQPARFLELLGPSVRDYDDLYDIAYRRHRAPRLRLESLPYDR